MKDGEKIHPEQNGYGWGHVVGQRDDRSDILSHSVLAVQVPQEITELESDRVLIYYAIWASAGGKPKKTSEQYLTVPRQRWEMALKLIQE